MLFNINYRLSCESRILLPAFGSFMIISSSSNMKTDKFLLIIVISAAWNQHGSTGEFQRATFVTCVKVTGFTPDRCSRIFRDVWKFNRVWRQDETSASTNLPSSEKTDTVVSVSHDLAILPPFVFITRGRRSISSVLRSEIIFYPASVGFISICIYLMLRGTSVDDWSTFYNWISI